jgi:hypothetical protein
MRDVVPLRIPDRDHKHGHAMPVVHLRRRVNHHRRANKHHSHRRVTHNTHHRVPPSSLCPLSSPTVKHDVEHWDGVPLVRVRHTNLDTDTDMDKDTTPNTMVSYGEDSGHP